jgi:hypothetical protein
MELKGRHFDTIEVTEAESQAVLNSLTEHDYQDAIKDGRNAGNGAYARKGTASRVMVACSPKLVFDQMSAPVTEIMDRSLLILS